MKGDIVRAPSAPHKQSSGNKYLPADKYAPRQQTYFLRIHGKLHDEWGDGAEGFAPTETKPGSKGQRKGQRRQRPGNPSTKRTSVLGNSVSGDKAEVHSTISKVTFESRNIDDLKPFPSQPLFYGEESQADDDALKQRLRNGQTERIPIMPFPNRAELPENTMLDGHRRTQLWKKIGTQQIKVVVRGDLADADFASVEAEFLQYNVNRRQLHQIDKARIAKRLFEIEKGRSRGALRSWEDAEARDRVGKVIGMGGRELQRYWRLLKTPLEVQNAVRKNLLPLTLGERVAGLKKEQQERIAEQIREITSVKSEDREVLREQKKQNKNMIEEHLASNSPGIDIQRRRLRAILQAVENLDGHIDEIPRRAVRGHGQRLARGQRLWRQLIALSNEPDPDE